MNVHVSLPTAKEQAVRDYAQYAADLDRLARDMFIVGAMDEAKWAARCADIAERAAKAEMRVEVGRG